MKKYIYLLLLTLVITNLVMLFMLIKKPHRRHSPSDFLKEKLNFNDDQKKTFNKLEDEHHKKMMSYDDAIVDLRKKIFNEVLSQNNFDNTITIEIGELETKKEIELYSFLIQIKKICNPEQVIELNKIFKRIIRIPTQGRRHPHKRKNN